MTKVARLSSKLTDKIGDLNRQKKDVKYAL
jgi:hypothetical protein